MRLILLAVVASAATAAGDGCSTGCNLTLASYHIALNQNLTYIASLFDIDDYRKLEPYNNFWLPNLIDPIPAGTRVTVNFPCRCLALPTAPFSTYLAGSFPYIVRSGDTYSSIAANFNNLTTAAWLQATNSYQNNNLDGRTVNVTVNCSCGYPGVPPDYKLFLTYPLGDGETLDSVEDKYNFRLQLEVGTRIVYIPLIGVSAIAPLPSPTDSPSKGPWKNKTTIMGNDR